MLFYIHSAILHKFTGSKIDLLKRSIKLRVTDVIFRVNMVSKIYEIYPKFPMDMKFESNVGFD